MGQARSVLLVSNHADTAELYAFALEAAGFSVRCVPSPHAAIGPTPAPPPMAIVVQLLPRHDPVAIGALLRHAAPAAAIIGLISVELPLDALTPILAVLDDVVMIPCTPDALVARVMRARRERPRRQPV